MTPWTSTQALSVIDAAAELDCSVEAATELALVGGLPAAVARTYAIAMRRQLRQSDFPILLELEWQDLEGWPARAAVLAELGPPTCGEDPWFDLMGWDPARGILADVRLWLERPGGAEGRLGVTPAMAAALAEAAEGPAQGALLEALLEGLGRSLPS
jgi:hypothetical protein